MDALLISVTSDAASDSWGFVGVVKVGEYEVYRTLESHPTPSEALAAAQQLMGTILGEALAGTEWRQLRESSGHAPTRQDLNLGLLRRDDGDQA